MYQALSAWFNSAFVKCIEENYFGNLDILKKLQPKLRFYDWFLIKIQVGCTVETLHMLEVYFRNMYAQFWSFNEICRLKIFLNYRVMIFSLIKYLLSIINFHMRNPNQGNINVIDTGSFISIGVSSKIFVFNQKIFYTRALEFFSNILNCNLVRIFFSI